MEIDFSNFEYYYLVNHSHKIQPIGNLTQIDETMYIFPPFTLSQNNQSGIYQCVLNDVERKYLSRNIASVRSSLVIFSGTYILLLLLSLLLLLLLLYSSVLYGRMKLVPFLPMLYKKYSLIQYAQLKLLSLILIPRSFTDFQYSFLILTIMNILMQHSKAKLQYFHISYCSL